MKVSGMLDSYLEVLGRIHFQPHSGYWLNVVLCGCRAEVSPSCWLSGGDCCLLLEAFTLLLMLPPWPLLEGSRLSPLAPNLSAVPSCISLPSTRKRSLLLRAHVMMLSLSG